MKVGFVGVGKLGLPVATAMAARGLEVYAYDPLVPDIARAMEAEEGFREAYEQGKGRLYFVKLQEVVKNAAVIFVAVPTPHEPEYEGITPLPEGRADFDYTYLREAVRDIVQAAESQKAHPTIAVISTVLPGTMEREIKPLLRGKADLVYNPSFIAMGTTIADFLDPEFVLLGGDNQFHVRRVYDALLSRWERSSGLVREHTPKFAMTSIANAELTKVAYNTFIGLKIAFANTLQEICHKTNCDVDEVTDALFLATRRLISPAYMRGGMGDGGACHPRDNIALSWLARELFLSYDLFEGAMLQRERHAEWLCDLLVETAGERNLPLGILGYAYKPKSAIITGSPALLVANLLKQRGYTGLWMYDPYVQQAEFFPSEPRCWLVGCKHPDFTDLMFPEGSVVIDPWRYMPDREGREVIRLGEHSLTQHGTSRDGRELRAAAA